ncbi:transposase [Marinomonas epiphytica]
MAIARSQLVSVQDTPFYHCVSRCVRRAFLCGEDPLTGVSYEHRRAWVEKRILYLASVFSIDICAYAVMSNHLHLVLHINLQKVNAWSTMEVLRRWHKLHKGTTFTQQFVKGEALPEHTLALVEETANTYRNRLCDLSWFMKELNEPIARKANEEDDCTGHFWEGRFKSQALLDEAALIACMAYVDLNPIRTGVSNTPEKSDFTSIKQRINALKQKRQPKALFSFVGNPRDLMPAGLPFVLTDYVELVDITGRILKSGKKGAINASLAPILQRLNISSENWLCISTEFEERTSGIVGQESSIQYYCECHSRRRKPDKKTFHKLA